MSDLNFKFGGRDLNDPKAGEVPVREVLPLGKYVAKIVDIKAGLTRQQPPQPKMSIEFMILHTARSVDANGVCTNEGGDRSLSGKRAFQDYLLNPEVRGDGNDFNTYRLRGLLSACQIPVVNNSFDATPMVGKDVLITITHRFGNPDANGKVPTFANVDGVDRVEVAGAPTEDIL